MRIWIAFSLLLVVACASSPTKITSLPPSILLISMDGFRWDYLNEKDTPNLWAISEAGVRAKGLKPVFPSVTFPNHYTIVTGLYSEHHGIVANKMFDPQTKRVFELGRPDVVDSPEWWEGEPIWGTAQKHKLPSATMFWVGSTAPIQGVHPTYWERYDAKVSKEDRIKKILGWLDLPAEVRPRFLSLYFEDADTAGHRFGPDSPEVKAAVGALDKSIGLLIEGLKERGLEKSLNLIIVSDHGMTALPEGQTIDLETALKGTGTEIASTGAVASLFPKPGTEDAIYKKVVKLPHAKAYRKKDIPSRYHYRAHRRIGPVVLVADEGWYFGKTNGQKGTHGYDNDLPNMKGIFVAKGAAFKSGMKVETLENIDIYELMCHILSLSPARNDGDLSRIKPVLR